MTSTPGRRGLAAWLVRHTRSLLPILGLSALARVAGQLLGVALLVMVAVAFAEVVDGVPFSVLHVAGGLVLVSLAKALLRYLEHYAGHWVAFTALARLRELFFARLVPQAPAATTGRAGAELTDRATRDIDRIEVFFAHTFPPAISAVITPVVALAWLAGAVDARLAAVTAGFVVAIVLVLPLLASRSAWQRAREVAARRGAIAAHLGDDLQGVREVLGFGIRDRRLDGLDAADRALGEARAGAARVQAVRSSAIVLLELTGLVAVLATGAAAGLPAAQVLIGLAVAVGLWAPARGVDDFVTGLDAAFAATARVRKVVDAEPLVTDPPGMAVPRPGGDLRLAVEFDGVTFAYPGATAPALTEVSLGLPPGAHSCVVGVSGSGKSTLAGLLLRGWDVATGTVRLFSMDVRELRLDEVRRRVALVPQRPTMVSGTIADNLRLPAPEASDEELREALAVAALDEWVDGLPQGLATPIAERGLNVSGGQLQRLTLARALLAEPDVLVLDEALSQLDARTAGTVRRRLAATRPGLTILEITHRADLIPDDVETYVLDAGRVVELGRADALRAAGGPFTALLARDTS